MKDATADKIGKHVVSGVTACTGLVIGSFISKTGTLVGTGLGATASSVTGEIYLTLFGRGRAKYAKLPVKLQRGMAVAAVAFIAVPLGVTGVEATTNKPLHATLTGQNVHNGTTFFGGTTDPGPAPTTSPSSSVTPPATPVGTAAPTLAPSPTTSPTTSPSPSATTTPSPSPTTTRVPATAPSVTAIPLS